MRNRQRFFPIFPKKALNTLLSYKADTPVVHHDLTSSIDSRDKIWTDFFHADDTQISQWLLKSHNSLVVQSYSSQDAFEIKCKGIFS